MKKTSTKYIGIDDKGVIIHSDDINTFSQEAAIFDKETGVMMNAENDKEANLKKLRKSVEALQSDTLLNQEQYLSLLAAAYTDLRESVQKQYRWVREYVMVDKDPNIQRLVWKRIERPPSKER